VQWLEPDDRDLAIPRPAQVVREARVDLLAPPVAAFTLAPSSSCAVTSRRTPPATIVAGGFARRLWYQDGFRERQKLEAMLDRAGEQVSVPDTGSARDDLLELTRTAAANAASPEVAAMARAVAAESPHDPRLAAANRRFWAERLALDDVIVERAIERGEAASGTDPGRVIESVLGPIHLRLLLTGEPIDRTFLEGIVDVVVEGIAPRDAA